MRIIGLIEGSPQFVSLEFFPPKDRAAWPGFFQVVEKLKKLSPKFVSVTYGAGGSTRGKTVEIVKAMKKEMGLEPMAHLTCVGASSNSIHEYVADVREAGVQNILALRGDPPKGESTFVPDSEEFQYASDLVSLLRASYPDLGIGVAGYPEGHAEAPDLETDLRHLKHKIDQGADFVITQFFFDNDLYVRFVERARDAGIQVPIIPGVLPVMSLSGVKRMLDLSGASIPEEYLSRLEDADERGGTAAVQRLGIEFAKRQVQDLLHNGAPGVHLYTLNKAEACLEIVQGFQ